MTTLNPFTTRDKDKDDDRPLDPFGPPSTTRSGPELLRRAEPGSRTPAPLVSIGRRFRDLGGTRESILDGTAFDRTSRTAKALTAFTPQERRELFPLLGFEPDFLSSVEAELGLTPPGLPSRPKRPAPFVTLFNEKTPRFFGEDVAAPLLGALGTALDQPAAIERARGDVARATGQERFGQRGPVPLGPGVVAGIELTSPTRTLFTGSEEVFRAEQAALGEAKTFFTTGKFVSLEEAIAEWQAVHPAIRFPTEIAVEILATAGIPWAQRLLSGGRKVAEESVEGAVKRAAANTRRVVDDAIDAVDDDARDEVRRLFTDDDGLPIVRGGADGEEAAEEAARRSIQRPPKRRPRATGRPEKSPTVQQLRSEARGQRALPPKERALAADEARPIDPGDLFYVGKDPEFHATTLLHDSSLAELIRRVPIVRRIAGIVSPNVANAANKVYMIAAKRRLFLEVENGRVVNAARAFGDDLKQAFGFDGTGRTTRLLPRAGANLDTPSAFTIDDLLKNPDKYQLTDAQRGLLQSLSDTQTYQLRQMQAAGVDIVEIDDLYLHRIVKRTRRGSGSVSERIKSAVDAVTHGDSGLEPPPRLGGQPRPPGKRAPQLTRVVDDLDSFLPEMEKRGLVFERDQVKRLTARLQAGNELLANQWQRNRLAELGTPLKERVKQATLEETKAFNTAAKAYRETVKKFDGTPSAANRTARERAAEKVKEASRTLDEATAKARRLKLGESLTPDEVILGPEFAKEAQRFIFAPPQDNVISGVNDAFRLLRALKTTLDNSQAFLQSQALFFRNNTAWWRAQGLALKSVVREPTEFLFAGRGIAAAPLRLPGVVGLPFRASNRAFEWGTFVGQVELYRARRMAAFAGRYHIPPATGGLETLSRAERQALGQLGSAIRKGLGVESYAHLGVSEFQALMESIVLFAPRFLRANAGLMMQAFTPGPGGNEARRILGSLLAGGFAVTAAMNWASDRKLPNVTDPSDPGWLLFHLPGTRTRFNAFGPFYSLMRAMARTGDHMAKGEFTEAAKVGQRFLESKSGLPVQAARDTIQVVVAEDPRTFEGRELKRSPLGVVTHIAREFFAPISTEEIVVGILEGRPEAVGEFFGLAARGSPFNQMDILFRQQKDINPDGNPFSEANTAERREMERRYPELAAQLDARSRGSFGTANRRSIEIGERLHDETLAIWTEMSPRMLRGEPGAAGAFRARVGAKLGDAATARREVFNDIKPRDPEDAADELDTALFTYFGLFAGTIPEGGVLNPDTREVDWDEFNRRLTELEREWEQTSLEHFGQANYILTYVEEQSGSQDLPEALRDYQEVTRLLRRLGWFDLWRTTPQVVKLSPDTQAWLEDGFRARSENRFEAWILEQEGPPDRVRAAIRQVDEWTDAHKRGLRAENPELDRAMVLYYGSPPVTAEVQAEFVSMVDGPFELRFVLSGKGRRLASDDRDALIGAGIDSVAKLARLTPERLANITGRRVETIRRWNWIGQAQAILRGIGRE